MNPFIGFVLSCLFVGLLGSNRRFGFWGYFFLSILLTPVGGLVALALTSSEARPGARRSS
jgi:hypothetical protein